MDTTSFVQEAFAAMIKAKDLDHLILPENYTLHLKLVCKLGPDVSFEVVAEVWEGSDLKAYSEELLIHHGIARFDPQEAGTIVSEVLLESTRPL